ncbi:MAG: DUF2911 domain-containing protein [Flavisolibacter sp.]
MKKLSLALLFVLSAFLVNAQTQASLNPPQKIEAKVPPIDKSPLDLAYFPADYPMLKTQNKATQPALARVIYSRPQRDNRAIFGELIEYDKVWRLGANEATEIEFYKDVVIGGKKLVKGRYTIYAIPTPIKWTMIINKDTDSWGAFIYDEKKDVVRTDVNVQTLTTPVDIFSMSFSTANKGANLNISWDSVSVNLPIIEAPVVVTPAKKKK